MGERKATSTHGKTWQEIKRAYYTLDVQQLRS